MRPPLALHPLHLWLVVATITASTSAAPSNSWATSPDAASSIFSPWKTFRSWVVTAITGDPSTPVHSFSGLEDPDRFRKAQFGNDMVLRFNISTIDEADSFAEACDTLFLDVWASTKSWVDVRISKDVIPSLLGLLPQSLQKAHIPLMRSADLLKAIGDSYPKSSPSLNDHGAFTPSLHRAGASTRGVFFDDYRPWNVITHWMRLMSSLFPSHVRLTTIGKSFEGRDIPAFHLGVHPTNSARPLGPRKTILITAGLHAREWISISTVNYIAYSLIRDYGKSPAVTKMLEHFDWIFVPSLNPDGYLYTWNSDRLWRKNRQPTPLPFCNGIDLDRSFDFRWNGSPGSGNPCSENYAGEAAFEGHEARILAAWAKNLTQNDAELITLLDLHSYSQEILYPYAFSCADDPPTLEDLEEMGEGLAKAIRRRGSYYSVISACEGNVLQPASALRPGKVRQSGESAGGSLLDWFYHELQAKIAYQFKLRDQGSWGFLLPPSYIVPVGDEILDAVMFLGEALLGHDAAAADKKEKPATADAPRDGTQKPLGDHGEFKT